MIPRFNDTLAGTAYLHLEQYCNKLFAENEALRDWRKFAYAHLGATRDRMSPEHVEIIQNWLAYQAAPSE